MISIQKVKAISPLYYVVVGTIVLVGILVALILFNNRPADAGSPTKQWDAANLTAIGTGEIHSCALSDGKVYCWGDNSLYGQVGDASGHSSSTPQLIESALQNKTVTSLSVGRYTTCAIAEGYAYCWGSNTSGQAGAGDSGTAYANPRAVSLSGVLADKTLVSVKTYNSHSCAIDTDGAAYCWGNDGNGQLGDGTTSSTNVPVAVNMGGALAGKTIKSISPGGSFTCAIASDDQVYCWGAAAYLGQGTSPISPLSPRRVTSTGVLSGKTVLSLSAGENSACVVASDNKVYCWGSNGEWLGNGSAAAANDPVAVSTAGVLSGKTISSVSVGSNSACVVATDAKAYCWGSNYEGAIGNATNITSDVPAAVDMSGALAGLSVTAVSTSGPHTCAIASSRAYCWGIGTFGELGDGQSSANRQTPVAVLANKIYITPTPQTIIADGSVQTTGFNGQGIAAGSRVWLDDEEVTVTAIGTEGTFFEVAVPTAGVTVDKTVDVKVVAPNGDEDIFIDGLTYDAPTPKVVTGITFEDYNGASALHVHGTGLVGETNSSEYLDALNRSLVTLNGTALPFCAAPIGQTAQSFIDGGMSASLVSDDAPCYLLLDGGLMLTTTSAIILLADDFDVAAQGSVSVNGSDAYAFNAPIVVDDPDVDDPEEANEPVVTPEPQTKPAVKPAASTPGITVASDAPVGLSIDSKEVAGITNISRTPEFSGIAPEGTTVTVTVHSDPVSCSAVADSNNRWSCRLAEELPAGSHTVNIVAVTPDGETHAMGPYDVVAVADPARETVAATETDVTEPVATRAVTTPWPWVIAGGVVLVILAIGIVAVIRRPKQA